MRTIQINDNDTALIFRGELGTIDLDTPKHDKEETLLNVVLGRALLERCSRDPDFVDEQIQWLMAQDEVADEINDEEAYDA